MKKKLVMLTAWDFPTAKILENAGIDYILVGDSLAMTVLGHVDTKEIGMEEMLHHVKAVCRGVIKTPVIADMPIGSYDAPSAALKNARKFIKLGANFVKIEGANIAVVKTLITNNIPVIGHLGLLPQTAEKYRVYGREEKEAKQILKNAIALDKAGVKLLILECVPVDLAKKITKAIKTPTIGIGAGKYTSGQVLVLADIIGLTSKKLKMVKQYANVGQVITNAVSEFKSDVLNGTFPKDENSFV